MRSLFNRNAEPAADQPVAGPTELMLAERACCCPGRPVVKVVMPPATDRAEATDLLLCGHHFRVSQETLSEAGATVYDELGQVVLAPSRPERKVVGLSGPLAPVGGRR